MNRNKLQLAIIAILAIINVGLVSFFILTKPPHPPRRNLKGNPKKVIVEKLHFNDEQIQSFESLIDKHQLKIKNKEIILMDLKHELFMTLKEKDIDNEDLLNKITIIKRDIEQIHFDHFLDIKAICNENQLENFNELTNILGKIFSVHKE